MALAEFTIAIAALKAALDLLEALDFKDELLDEVKAKIAQFEAELPRVQVIWEYVEELLKLATSDTERRAAEAAIAQNPAIQKPRTIPGNGTLALLIICLGMIFFSGCAATNSKLHEFPETPERYASYAYVWPEDISTNPTDFQTVEVDGLMITTAPKKADNDEQIE